MSLYIGLKQVKTAPLNYVPQTPRFSQIQVQNTDLINQVYAIVQHISKPKERYKDFQLDNEQNWTIHRQIYMLPMGNMIKEGTLIKGQTSAFQQTKSRYLSLNTIAKSKYFNSQISPIKQSEMKRMQSTPYSKLNSPEKQFLQHSRLVYQNANNEIIATKMHQIPLHSQQCKIVIKFYYFESERQRQYFLQSPRDLKPFHQLTLLKDQMNELIQQLKNKTRKMTGQSKIMKVGQGQRQQIYKLSAQKQYDNHSKKVVFSPYNTQFTKLEIFQFAIDSSIDNKNFMYGAHNVFFMFQVGLQRSKQFTGFMKNTMLGQSKIRNSTISTNEKLQQSNYNFNYNLDFSGKKLKLQTVYFNPLIKSNTPKIYLGKCQNVNAFSCLDQPTLEKQAVYFIQPDYLE